MREIKFRAWDTLHNKYMTIGSILEWFTFNGPTTECNFFIDTQERFQFSDRFILEQYTGLKDSKRTKEYPEGQEIYEGDIVIERSYPMYCDGLCNYRCVVVWYDDQACFGLEMYCVSERVRGCAIPNSISEYPELEAIGNIHEHSHLLKEKP
jgi:hypothetical protein